MNEETKQSGKNMRISELATMVSELAETTQEGFKEMRQDFEDLGGMVARGFTSLREEMKGDFEQVDARFGILGDKSDQLRDGMNDLNYSQRKVKSRLENVQTKVFGSVQEA